MEKLNSLFLSPEVHLLFFLECFLLLVLSVAFFHAITILKNWVKGETTNKQYQLEKKSYLVTTTISVTFFIKILLLPFFIYTINELAVIIPGAMCAAGVVWANSYGTPLLFIKISLIILTALWLSLNHQDNVSTGYPYFKIKLWFFIILYILMIAELVIEFIFLSKQSTATPVMCCSSIFGDNGNNINQIPLNLTKLDLVIVFYISYISVMISAYFRSKIALSISAIISVYFSYYAIIYFFGIYIYELPTHKCPFCLLQSEYNYIGYFIFGSLFIAIYYTLSVILFNFKSSLYSKVKIWFTFFVIITSFSFIKYLLINGVFL